MDPRSPLAHSKHVFRVGFLFLLGVVALIILRSLAAPPTWGKYGPYRAASVGDYRALPVRHGDGSASCAECHDDKVSAHDQGVHKSVNCEICHAPLASHIKDGDVVAEMPVPQSSDFCLRCHRQLNARPEGFPQIQPRQHVEDMGGEPGPRACFDCHDPHSPL